MLKIFSRWIKKSPILFLIYFYLNGNGICITTSGRCHLPQGCPRSVFFRPVPASHRSKVILNILVINWSLLPTRFYPKFSEEEDLRIACINSGTYSKGFTLSYPRVTLSFKLSILIFPESLL